MQVASSQSYSSSLHEAPVLRDRTAVMTLLNFDCMPVFSA